MANRMPVSALAWHDGLLTGIDALDVQHKALFDYMATLDEVIEEQSVLRICYVLEQLGLYAQNYFRDEESLLRLHDYPRLAEHIREHRDFTNQLFHVRKAILSHHITGELLNPLRQWVAEHVSRSDMDYVPFLIPERRLLPAAC